MENTYFSRFESFKKRTDKGRSLSITIHFFEGLAH